MADIISMLVNIYGSKDLFVSEYRSLLADRILSSFSYDVSNERRYLELLKRRFGESHLHFCDTMLKDVQDSQRMNRHIKDKLAEKLDDAVDVNALILSAVYWPPFKDDQVTLPDSVKRYLLYINMNYKSVVDIVAFIGRSEGKNLLNAVDCCLL